MFGHLPEFFIILVIALLVFGPERLPEVAHSAGKMVRELRQALDVGMNPRDVEVPTDFSTYYYESMQRTGEEVEPAEVDMDAHHAAETGDGGSVFRETESEITSLREPVGEGLFTEGEHLPGA